MPLKHGSATSWALLIPAAICIGIYATLGVIGLWVFGGRISDAKDLFFVAFPLLSIPAFSVTFWGSLQKGATCLWVYFIAKWLFVFLMSLPMIAWEPISSAADWLVLIPPILVQVAAIIESRRSQQPDDSVA